MSIQHAQVEMLLQNFWDQNQKCGTLPIEAFVRLKTAVFQAVTASDLIRPVLRANGIGDALINTIANSEHTARVFREEYDKSKNKDSVLSRDNFAQASTRAFDHTYNLAIASTVEKLNEQRKGDEMAFKTLGERPRTRPVDMKKQRRVQSPDFTSDWKSVFRNPRCFWSTDAAKYPRFGMAKSVAVFETEFGFLFKKKLADTFTLSELAKFCEDSFCEDMLSFILAVGHLRRYDGSQEEINAVISKIIYMFVAVGSPHELGIAPAIKARIVFLGFKARQNSEPLKIDLFDTAVSEGVIFVVLQYLRHKSQVALDSNHETTIMRSARKPAWDKMIEDIPSLWDTKVVKHHRGDTRSVFSAEFHGKIPYEISLNTFASFCEEQCNEEMLAFILLLGLARRQILNSKSELKDFIKLIIDTFIKTNAKYEINVNQTMKDTVLKKVEKSEGSCGLEIFNEAAQNSKQMLTVQFLSSEASQPRKKSTDKPARRSSFSMGSASGLLNWSSRS